MRASEDPRAMCFGKTQYLSKTEALNRIRHANQRKRADKRSNHRLVLQAYRCPSCHYWHVGSTSKDLLNRKRDKNNRLLPAERAHVG